MIDINLIPGALAKNAKGKGADLTINLPQEVLVGAASGVVLLMVLVHLVLGVVWLLAYGNLSKCNAKWATFAADKAALDAIADETRSVKGKTDLIAGMTTKKTILWSPKLNAVSDAMTRGLWIRKMTLDKAGLSIEGSVVSKTRNEINNVGLFLSSLRQNNAFIKDFASLEVNTIERGKNNEVEVTEFTVMAKLNEVKPATAAASP